MDGIQNLPLFVASGLLLNLTPGPDTLLIVRCASTQGWRAGSAAAFGIGAGVMVHVLLAALGLSAALATSATAFALLKYAGAAYLLYVAAGLLLGRGAPSSAAAPESGPTRALPGIFVQGFLTNVLNPKVAVFFLAFVPQFIAPDAPDKALAFVVLGCIFDFNAMLWCHFVAVSSAFASRRFRPGPALARWLDRLVGAVFVSFALRLALSARD